MRAIDPETREAAQIAARRATKPAQWNVKGVDEATRSVARDAAAAAGLPIGAWIDRAIKRAAAAQTRVAPPPVQPPIAPERSLIECAADAAATEVDRSPDDPPVAELTPERPPDHVDRLPNGRSTVRGPRIALAVAIVATLIGGAVWHLSDQLWPPSAPEELVSPASGVAVAPPAAAVDSAALRAPALPEVGFATTAESAALQALRQAAQGGDPRAQYDLGIRHVLGQDVTKDDVQAAHWFEHSAVQGLASAQYNLGVMYDRAMGLPEDPDLAFFWYRSAADQGHPRAQHNVATAYANGRGTQQDLALAAKWFEKAAAAGSPESQYYLGAMYERGIGVPRDTTRALGLYQLAAGQGHREAAERLMALSAMMPSTSFNVKAPEAEESSTAMKETVVPRATVAEIQRLLSRLDFDPGPADGVLGKKTVEAIAKYQAMSGVTADGKPSTSLLEELREVTGTAKR